MFQVQAVGATMSPRPSSLPPGLQVILPSLPVLLIPILGAYTISLVLNFPTWALVLLEVASFPVFVIGRIWIKVIRERYAVARFGAAFPPHLEGVEFANGDTVRDVIVAFRHGYIGASSLSHYSD